MLITAKGYHIPFISLCLGLNPFFAAVRLNNQQIKLEMDMKKLLLTSMGTLMLTACAAPNHSHDHGHAHDQERHSAGVEHPVQRGHIVTVHEHAREQLGMTWGKAKHVERFNMDMVSCHGQPRFPDGQGRNGSCNPYQGDTSCKVARPILCLKVDGSARPPYEVGGQAHAMEKAFYNGWASGSVALTSPVVGSEMYSREAANQMCASQLGEGYRMASHHDGRYVSGMDGPIHAGETWPTQEQLHRGGWAWNATGNVSNESRFWVAIDDQPGNCWD